MHFLALFGADAWHRTSNSARRFGTSSKCVPHLRSAVDAQSEVLSDLAHSWVRELPLTSRPLELCNVYPRVANRIAGCWNNLAGTEAVLDDLLVEHRSGRKGFRRKLRSSSRASRRFMRSARHEADQALVLALLEPRRG